MMENDDDVDEEVDINMPVHLIGATTEFKMEQNKMFADMTGLYS